MGVAGGAAEAAAAVELLVEALQQCAAPVRTRRPADGACWRAVATLCALWHTLEGRPMAATLGGAAPPAAAPPLPTEPPPSEPRESSPPAPPPPPRDAAGRARALLGVGRRTAAAERAAAAACRSTIRYSRASVALS